MEKKFKLELYRKDTQLRPSKILYFKTYDNMITFGLGCVNKEYQCLLYYEKVGGKYQRV